MRFILVQGIGCTETGARVVLRELLMGVPSGRKYWVFCTTETAIDFIGKRCGLFGDHVYLVGLSHRFFGRWFRPVLELLIAWTSVAGFFEAVVNVSHYGLCLGGNYVLYFHSQPLLDAAVKSGWNGGKPNLLKLGMLDSCIRNARFLVVQSHEVERDIGAYCGRRKLRLPRIHVLCPSISISRPNHRRRVFDFQLFYPTSRFIHKRAELAIVSGCLAHEQKPDLGLVITTEPDEDGEVLGVHQAGRISREAVYEWFAGSDALLFTSERETLGLPLLEALEFGLPVIAPRLPYAIEILGEAGCYFDEPAPEVVAEAIIRCCRDYSKWKSRIAAQALIVHEDSTTWKEHWKVFLSCGQSRQQEHLAASISM